MKKYRVKKTFREINEKIRQGKAVVVTAEEMIGIVERQGHVTAAQKVDVVTTGTFSPMCSSGAFLNFGHTAPKIAPQKSGLTMFRRMAALPRWTATSVPQRSSRRIR